MEKMTIELVASMAHKGYQNINQNEKVHISVYLLGGVLYGKQDIGFDHVKKVLNEFCLTPLEARLILQDSRQAHSEIINKKISRTIDYLKGLIELEQQVLFANQNNLVKNKYPDIFTKEGYNLFLKLHHSYEDKDKYLLANYSYIFYALEKDKLVLCTQAEYVEFLSSLNIHIDKVDSRQSGGNKRDAFYVECKKNILGT